MQRTARRNELKSAIKEKHQDNREKFVRKKLRTIVDDMYLGMKKRVYRLSKQGINQIEVQFLDDDINIGLKVFFDDYYKEEKNIIYKNIMPDINDDMKGDFAQFTDPDLREKNITRNANLIREEIIHSLGNKIGGHFMIDEVEQEVLTPASVRKVYAEIVQHTLDTMEAEKIELKLKRKK